MQVDTYNSYSNLMLSELVPDMYSTENKEETNGNQHAVKLLGRTACLRPCLNCHDGYMSFQNAEPDNFYRIQGSVGM